MRLHIEKEQRYLKGYDLFDKGQSDCCTFCGRVTAQSERRCDHTFCDVALAAATAAVFL